MHERIWIGILIAVAMFVAGCGYTELQRNPPPKDPCAGIPDSLLPDLSIDSITVFEGTRLRADATNSSEPYTDLFILIRNYGPGTFRGSILCDFAKNEKDIKARKYPAHTFPETVVMEPGDSIIVRSTLHAWYPTDWHFRFILRTDSHPLHAYDPIYYFGREPVCESRYDNNVADLYFP